jgi:hypothetical protein
LNGIEIGEGLTAFALSHHSAYGTEAANVRTPCPWFLLNRAAQKYPFIDGHYLKEGTFAAPLNGAVFMIA